jgi:hypothetical protein
VVERVDVQFRLDGQERGRHGGLLRQSVFDLRLPDFDAAVVLGIVARTVDRNDQEGFEKMFHDLVIEVPSVVPFQEQRRSMGFSS